MNKEFLLVAAPLSVGEGFFRLLAYRQIPFAVLINQREQREKLRKLGVTHIVEVDTQDPSGWMPPDFEVGRVLLFEDSLNLTCRYLQMCRQWTEGPICVITGSAKPRALYRGLGASRVVYCPGGDIFSLAVKTYQSISV